MKWGRVGENRERRVRGAGHRERGERAERVNKAKAGRERVGEREEGVMRGMGENGERGGSDRERGGRKIGGRSERGGNK